MVKRGDIYFADLSPVVARNKVASDLSLLSKIT